MHRFRLKLNLQLFAQEKTEKATPKKRQEARQKGQVAKSMDLPAALILLFSFLVLLWFGDFFKDHVRDLFAVVLTDYLLMDITIDNIHLMFVRLFYQGLIVLSPILIATVLVAVLGNYLQFGFLVSIEPLKMKFEKLNPLQGMKNIFSLRSLVEFLKSTLKMLIIGGVALFIFFGEKSRILSLSAIPLDSILSYAADVTMSLGLKIGAILVILAFFDYIYQRYEYEKNLRMSKQDIKDEYKKTEGDPLIKGKIRERQRKMALQRMMQEIPKADVVITNPTHFAIAIQYDVTQMDAPKVIAKGMDYIALKIKELAKEHGVITMENKLLARTLYEQVEVGEAIPPELFQAVAEVLAYVYRLKGKAN